MSVNLHSLVLTALYLQCFSILIVKFHFQGFEPPPSVCELEWFIMCVVLWDFHYRSLFPHLYVMVVYIHDHGFGEPSIYVLLILQFYIAFHKIMKMDFSMPFASIANKDQFLYTSRILCCYMKLLFYQKHFRQWESAWVP